MNCADCGSRIELGESLFDDRGQPFCLVCAESRGRGLREVLEECQRLRDAIRRHRDYRGDDRCYLDDRELYAVLPEGYTPPPHDSAVTLEQCVRFIRCREDPATEYVSPQREIERLQAELNRATRNELPANEGGD